MPIAIGYLPLLGLEFLAHESFHQWMVLICFGIAIYAFVPGWRRHRRVLPAAVGVFGLSVIAASAFFFTDSCCAAGAESGIATTHVCTESCCLHSVDAAPGSDQLSVAVSPLQLLGNYASWLTPFGGLMLVGAHLLNHRYTCRRSCCATDSRETKS
ncbi:MerC domain-containing protein [Stieleria sp. TO1_6]|nr:MerC domain-containing protein [Stieleria tagensis]